MAEEKKMIVELKKEDRELLKSVIEAVSPKKETSEPKKSSEGHEGHETIEQIIDCPNCYPTLAPKVLQKEHKNSDWFCSDCGYPLGDEEHARKTEKCPTCGGEHATKRKR